MTQTNLCWFCPDVTFGSKGASSNAVLVSPIAAGDFEIETFSAHLISEQFVVPVNCTRAIITELAAGQDEHGNPATLFDGEVNYSGVQQGAIEAVQNQVKLYLEGLAASMCGPALITSDERAGFVCHSVVVDLLCTTLAELPDFVANLACSRAFEDMIRGDWPRPPSTFTDELLAYADKVRLGPGLVLPVEYLSGVNHGIAALVLDRQLLVSPTRFSGHLYPFHTDCRFQVGTILTRRIGWGKDDNHRTQCRAIARIVSLSKTAVSPDGKSCVGK